MSRPRYLSLAFIVVLVLMFAAARPYAVFADDETPATPEPTEVPVATDTPTAETPSTEEAPSPAEIIEQLPEGTDIVVLDESGEVLSLVTEEAAEILVTADPVWCPAAQLTPTPGSNGCTAGYGNMTDLLTYLTALNGGTGPGASGTIWIEDSYDSSVNDPLATNFTLDGTTLTTWDDYALTVQGGWNGASGNATITGVSEFNVPLRILNWNNNVTLNDLLFDSIVYDGVTTGSGLHVTTGAVASANILLNNVDATNNDWDGAELINNSTSGTVTVNDGVFSDNDGDGLFVQSYGAISANNLTANDNVSIHGAWLNNSFSAGAATVTLTGTNVFNDNGEHGLLIQSNGAISVANVTAGDGDGDSIGNTWSGAYLDNYDGGSGSGGVTVSGSNSFNENAEYGLVVRSNGAISLNNVTASDNYDNDGANLVNDTGTGGITLTGTNVFNNNNWHGLFALTTGVISANNLTANGNDLLHGAWLDNSSSASAATVTLTGTNVFNDNGGHGLLIQSNGAISILTGTNVFNDNGEHGLRIQSNGAISIANVTAGDGDGDSLGNPWSGAYLDNTDGGSGSGGVTVSGSNSFNENGEYGLVVHSNGAISLNNVTASDNYNNDGANLVNDGGTGGITLTGTNVFNNNNWNGLFALTTGAISANNLTANSNDLFHGVELDNSFSASAATVTLTGTNVFNDNGEHGLLVQSNGAISVANVTAGDGDGDSIGNTWSGAFLDNYDGGFGSGGVTVSGSSYFNHNNEYGLVVLSNGAISLSDVTADRNYYTGALLDDLSGTGDITIDASSFSDNWYDGLNALSNGSITLTNVTANSNNSFDCDAYCAGAYLEADGDITIDPSSFSLNYFAGLIADAGDSISLSDVNASYNDGNGAYLDNSAGAGDVSIVNSVFDHNTSSGTDIGLLVVSTGSVTLNNVSASSNSAGDGGDIYSFSSLSIQNSVFNNNYSPVNSSGWGWGLFVVGPGSVSLINVQTSGNSSAGTSGGALIATGGDIFIDPSFFNNNTSGPGLEATAGGDITVICSEFMNNGGYGIDADLPGTLTLNGVTLGGNGLGDTSVIAGATLVIGAGDCDPNKKVLPAFPALPINEVQVTGGEGVGLDCAAFRGTVLILPNGDSALFPCPLQDSASLATVGADSLPGDLPDGDTFGSAFTAGVEKNGSAVSTLDSSITLSFVIPDGMGDSLVILFWDGSQWTEVAGGHSVNGHFEAGTNHTGTFVLVSK